MCKEAVHMYTHLYLSVDLLHACAYMGVFVDLSERVHMQEKQGSVQTDSCLDFMKAQT